MATKKQNAVYFLLHAILFIACAYWGIYSLVYFLQLRRDYRKLTAAVPCQLTLDLTRKGCVRVPFHHTLQTELGCTAYLDFDEKLDFVTLSKLFGPTPVKARYFIGDQLISEELLGLAAASSFVTRSVHSQAFLRLFTPSIYGKLPPGNYTLELEVLHPTSQPRYGNCALTIRYAHNAAACLPILLHEITAVVLLLLALVAVLAFIKYLRLFRLPPKAKGSKIIYLLTSYPCWSETFLRLDLTMLKKQGVPIQVYALFPGNCAHKKDWPEATILSQDTPTTNAVTAKATALGQSLIPSWLNEPISLFKHRRLLKKLIKLCKDNEISHIHAEFADLAALLAAKAAEHTGCTYSIGIHALDIHALKYPKDTLFDEAKFITVCNQNAANAFKELCPEQSSSLHLIHHGINIKAWEYRPEQPVSSALELLFVGRFVPKKGIPILVNALHLLIHQHRQKTKLTLIGDGPMETEIRQQVEELALSDYVVFTGRLLQDDIKGYFKTTTCLCVPSIIDKDGDQDGIPNVVPEAMAAGVPVIGSQAGSLREVLTEETGWEIQDLTPESLAEAILNMAAQPQETERRRQNARNMIDFRFDAEKLAEKRAELFAAL